MPDYDAGFKIVAHVAGPWLARLGRVRCGFWEPIRGELQAWFKSPDFWVTARTESGLAWRQAKNGCWRRLIGLGQMKAEHVQPVRVRLARQQLGWAFVNAFGPFAAQEAAMVEEELQQVQVVRPQMSAKEEVAA